MRKIFSLLLLLCFSSLHAQQPKKLNAAEIYKKIQQLNFLGSVLYLAAHPDDENTRLITYLSNELHARTGYLSLTRGDGGQNLIGPELGPLLGVIRTQELLAARRIDGGHQFFSRANDFGYSKHPKETLNIWNKEAVLQDVVRTIRKFRPDIIINRFDHTTPGTTHGHHTTSAILGVEAFDIAGKPTVFPDQLKGLKPWQPQKLFHNTSAYFYPNEESFDEVKKTFIELETGVYFPLLGLSTTEIAARSRSQHSSQGFGSTGTRGEANDYLKLIKGNHPAGSNSLFAGINTSWSRLQGGEDIGNILEQVQSNFNFKDPAASLPQLMQAYELIRNLKDDHWKTIKTAQISEIIAACAGLFLEAVAEQPTATKGESISVAVEAINRSSHKIKLTSIEIMPGGESLPTMATLSENNRWTTETDISIPSDAYYTTPYWLAEESSLGMYQVKEPKLIGLPETPVEFTVDFNLEIFGTPISFSRPIVYKTNDPAIGEIYAPFDIIPEVSASIANKVVIFASHVAKVIPVKLQAHKDSLQGSLELQVPDSWKVSPVVHDFNLEQQGEEKIFYFNVTPPEGQEEAYITPIARTGGETFTKELISLEYEHIPVQKVLLPAAAKVVKLDIEKRGNLIGYIQGAGDLVPQSLEQIGYKVAILDPTSISSENLDQYDAVVVGIRAYNTVEALQTKQKQLLEYVKKGGNLIVQYNTSRGFSFPDLAPYPLELSSNRVTNEASPVKFIAPEHRVLNHPNKITSEDFSGWMQERGLYFPNFWSKEFTPILSMNDPGEPSFKGSLLVAPYGKGHYIYTGLSFFRELPAGVPGAFRLFANLVSMDSESRPDMNSNASN